VGGTTESKITLAMNIDLKVITKFRINITHIIGCLKKKHDTGVLDVVVGFGFCVS